MRALLDAWKEDLRYRVSRVKARMKFMVDDYGPEGMREEVEQRLGHTLPDFALRAVSIASRPTTWASSRAEAGVSYVGAGAPRPDLRRPDVAVAELAAGQGGDVRSRASRTSSSPASPTRRAATRPLAEIGFPSMSPAARHAIGCTGEPHCNFAVAETKGKLGGSSSISSAGSATRSRSCALTSTAAPTPAASIGSVISASRARLFAMPRASVTRRYDVLLRGGARTGRRNRPSGVPPGAGRGARRDRRAPDRRLARATDVPGESFRRTATA